jgi:hypothetical protein
MPFATIAFNCCLSPPTGWIQERLTKLKDILERHSERSGLLLRKLLGPLRLEPTCADENDRPFYKATTSLNAVALVNPLIDRDGRNGGFEFFAMVDVRGFEPLTPCLQAAESFLIAPSSLLVSNVFNNSGNLLSLKS